MSGHESDLPRLLKLKSGGATGIIMHYFLLVSNSNIYSSCTLLWDARYKGMKYEWTWTWDLKVLQG